MVKRDCQCLSEWLNWMFVMTQFYERYGLMRIKRLTEFNLWLSAPVALIFLALLFLPGRVSAQAAPAGGASSSGTLAPPLPVSGRTAQSGGGVSAAQQPIPGTTTSVNTLNPTVQVQGTYAG